MQIAVVLPRMIKVFGHKAPDTDSTCSAIVWAWYLTNHTAKKAEAFVLGDLNSETRFVLNRWNMSAPQLLEGLTEDDEVVIVDTNNPQELPDDLEKASIIEIIDHHKLVGGLKTVVPPTITIRPLACTATVMYDLMQEKNITPSTEIAGLMLSCIISDTLLFRSPTTTPHDKDVAEKLAAELDIDLEKYADEMFTAKSDISDFTDIGLIRLDSKKYEVGDTNFRVSVVETTSPAMVLDRKAGLVEAIETVRAEESDIEEVLFFIIDILKEEATALTYNDRTKDIIAKSFGVAVDEDTEVLPGIVSRKKQILPVLKA